MNDFYNKKAAKTHCHIFPNFHIFLGGRELISTQAGVEIHHWVFIVFEALNIHLIAKAIIVTGANKGLSLQLLPPPDTSQPV